MNLVVVAVTGLVAAGCGRIGYTPVASDGGDDAAPDLAEAGDGGGACPKACNNGCDDGTCHVGNGASRVNCPAGMPCQVVCDSTQGCKLGVQCGDATSCTVLCAGNDSCGTVACEGTAACDVHCTGTKSCSAVTCGAGRCSVECAGTESCTAVSCAASCACQVTCPADANCSADGGAVVCPAGCAVAQGCASAGAGCTRCP